ncbi:MAG: hypothetical protein RRA32_09950 [bacterium]|nr:hypothetical protein [bacterium]
MSIYEVMDFYTGSAFPEMEEVIGRQQKGLELYTRGEWVTAREELQKALHLNPDDKASWTLLQRCLHFEKKPPREDWDGVWEMDSK